MRWPVSLSFVLILLLGHCEAYHFYESECVPEDATCEALLAVGLFQLPGNPTYVAAATEGAFYSDDGINFVQANGFALGKVTYGNGIFVALPSSPTTQVVYYSTDAGRNWQSSASFATANLTGLYFSGTNFVALGDDGASGYCKYSTNASSWQDCSIPTSGNAANGFTAIARNTNTDQLIVTSTTAINSYVSSDHGLNWSVTSNMPTQNVVAMVYATDSAGSAMVGTGGATAFSYSTDGGVSVAWSNYAASGDATRAIANAGGINVMVGGTGSTDNVWHSTNHTQGSLWSLGSGTTGSDVLNGVVYGLDRFVAVGSNSVIYHSTDGINWSSGSTATGSVTFNGVAYGLAR